MRRPPTRPSVELPAEGGPADEGRNTLPARRRVRPIRVQLLVAVNSTLAVLIAAFLAFDYHRELADRLAQKQVALKEEAETLLPAVLHFRHEGESRVQAYLDAVCGRMHDAESPGHHLAVRLGATVLQATPHQRSSPEIFAAMQRAARSPEHQALFQGRELMVGSVQRGDATVYVSEEADHLYQHVRGQILWRLARVLGLGLVAAVVVSVVLLQVIARPMNRLMAALRRIAAGDLSVRTGPFNSLELNYLARTVNAMTATLEKADRHRRGEMAKARQIQQHLLPNSTDVPNLDLAFLYRPATDVAGDYYDLIPLPDGTWLICLADVCGHGVPAALSAALLKAFLQHAAEHHVAPHAVLAFVNERFAASSPPGIFASMLLIRWDPERRQLHYANAGHEPGWCVSPNGELQSLPATGLPLGIDAESEWTTETLDLVPGDRLLLVTDGVTETFNSQHELFGRERLAALLSQARDVPLPELLARLEAAVTEHRGGRPPADDLTVVAIEFAGGRRELQLSSAPSGIRGFEEEFPIPQGD